MVFGFFFAALPLSTGSFMNMIKIYCITSYINNRKLYFIHIETKSVNTMYIFRMFWSSFRIFKQFWLNKLQISSNSRNTFQIILYFFLHESSYFSQQLNCLICFLKPTEHFFSKYFVRLLKLFNFMIIHQHCIFKQSQWPSINLFSFCLFCLWKNEKVF